MSSIELTEYARGGGKHEKDGIPKWTCCVMYQLPCRVCGILTPTKTPKSKRCQSCAKAEMRDYSRWYYSVHRDEMREYHRIYHMNNRELILAQHATWHAAKRAAAELLQP